MGKGNRIKEWRKHRGLTLEVLAGLSGLSVSYLSRMENEKCNVSLKNLARLTGPLGVGQSDLVVNEPGTPDAWIAWFLKGRDNEEVERMKNTLQAAFPEVIQKTVTLAAKPRGPKA